MRTFTRFKTGDVVKIQPHALSQWMGLSGNREAEFTVARIIPNVNPHAYDDECINDNCVHSWAHPDQIVTVCGRLISAYYFDPECGKYQTQVANQARFS